MKVVSFFLLFLCTAVTVQAQYPVVSKVFPPQTRAEQTLLGSGGTDSPASAPAITSEQLYYFDANKKTFVRQFPNISQAIYLISQRFTAPSPETFLDSVSIYFPTIATGDIKIDVFRDTTLAITVGGSSKNFHLPNIYSQNLDYLRLDTARILFDTIEGSAYASIGFNSRRMTDEFHLQMSARRRSDVVDPAFTLRMSADSLVLTDLSPENSRLCFVLIDGSTGVYWERTQSQQALFAPSVDMYATVHYDDATGLDDVPVVGGMAIQGLYPHPVSRVNDGSPTMALRLETSQQIDIAVYDVMGRKVREAFSAFMPVGNQLVNLPVSDLLPGTYLVRMQGAHSVASRRLVIVE